jgi:hypothetical protein
MYCITQAEPRLLVGMLYEPTASEEPLGNQSYQSHLYVLRRKLSGFEPEDEDGSPGIEVEGGPRRPDMSS